MSTAHAMMQHTLRFPRSNTKVIQVSNFIHQISRRRILIFLFQFILIFSFLGDPLPPPIISKEKNKEVPKSRGKVEFTLAVYSLVETEHGKRLVASFSRGGSASEEFLRGSRSHEGPGSSSRSHHIAQEQDSKRNEMKALISNAKSSLAENVITISSHAIPSIARGN